MVRSVNCTASYFEALRVATLFFLFAVDPALASCVASACSKVVLFGNFVILNLFLAILMSNFDEQRSKLHEAMESRRELTRAGRPFLRMRHRISHRHLQAELRDRDRWAWDSNAGS